ncbi:MAG: M14 family zinc carboxypeptidase, partial [Gemmatimonadota bacterium]
GESSGRPALLVIAGARADHEIGTEVALASVARLSEGYGTDPEITSLLDRVTVYVIPVLGPDAERSARERPIREAHRNAQPRDDDRDGYVDEDGPDDLNGDGLITMMRIEDPTGDYMEDTDDPGLMRIALPARGEHPGWRLMTEGMDDDGDGRFNEDPAGGVDIGLNFPRRFPWFEPAAGDYPLSAPESRAVAQLLADRDEIGTVLVLGTRDNLLSAWKPEPGRRGPNDAATGGTEERIREPLSHVLSGDAPWYAEIARRYRETTGRAEADTLGIRPQAGDPLSWAYFQMGRWAFGSSVWTPTAVAEPDSADSPSAVQEPEAGGTAEDGGIGTRGDRKEDPVAAERRLLRWIRANRPEGFVDWEPVDHPDFAGRRVEVGGFVPFAGWTLPAIRDSIVRGEVDFMLELAALLPRIEILEAKAESLGDATWRISARIANTGFLPTRTELAGRMGRPRPVRVDLETTGQQVAGGRAVQLLDTMPGGGAANELTWIVVGRGNGRVTIRAGSPSTGSDRKEVELR